MLTGAVIGYLVFMLLFIAFLISYYMSSPWERAMMSMNPVGVFLYLIIFVATGASIGYLVS
jgi:NADH:ubiquinone oxidoreductase subunit 3 (subunit A)